MINPSVKNIIKSLNAKQYAQSNTIALTKEEQRLIDKYSPKDILVVYGSLAPNESNFSVVEHIKGQWKKGL
ncbi:MAG: hypothetical protein AB8G11_03070 [Saprospiraceae bacterium]